MARVTCRCGNVMSTTQCPNDVQLYVYTDKEWDNILDSGIKDPLDIPSPKYDVWKCPRCGRVYVYEQGCGEPVMVYVPEDK